MEKKQAFALVSQLLDVAVKAGIFKTANEVVTLQKAINILKPDEINIDSYVKKEE
jgi:hypothetical protein